MKAPDDMSKTWLQLQKKIKSALIEEIELEQFTKLKDELANFELKVASNKEYEAKFRVSMATFGADIANKGKILKDFNSQKVLAQISNLCMGIK